MIRNWLDERLARPSSPVRALVAIWITTLAASALALLAHADRTGMALALVAVLTALVLSSAVCPPAGMAPALFDVAFLAGLVTWIGFGLRTLLLLGGLLDPTSSLALLPGYGRFSDADLAAVALAVATWAALLVAYRTHVGAFLGQRIAGFRITAADSAALVITILVCAALGWFARVALFIKYPTPFEHLAPGTMTATDTFLTWLTVLTTVSMGLALYRIVYLGGGRLAISMAIALVIAEIGAGLATGSRVVVVSTVLTVLLLLSIAGVLRLRAWHLVVVPLVLLLYGASWLYRTVPAPAGQAMPVGARVEAALEAIAAAGPVGVLQAGAANFVDRYQGLETVRQIIVLGQPDQLDWGGRYLLALPEAVVPRFSWPGKPVNSLPREFGIRYLSMPPESNVPIAPTWIGDLALSFPLVLVPVAVMGVGVALRVVNELGRRARLSTSLMAVAYVIVVPIVIQSDGWIDVQIYAVVRLAVALTAAAILIVIVRRAQAHRAGRRVAREMEGA